MLEIPDRDSEEELEHVIEQIAYRDLDIPVTEMQESEGETHPRPPASARRAAGSP